MYVFFIISYENVVHAHNYWFFWKRLFLLSYFNFMTLMLGNLKVGQYDPQPSYWKKNYPVLI